MRNFLFLFILLFTNQVWAQQINWKYEDIITDVRLSGKNPTFVVDNQGNMHISFWNSVHDRLIYGFQATGTQQWVFEEVDSSHASGYISQIRINPLNGNPAIAFVENYSNQCVLRYAEKSNGTWQIESPENNEPRGMYGPNALVSPGYIHISLDLKFSTGNKPTIVFFDGSYDYDTPEYYGLETWLAVKNGSIWTINGFGNIPIFDPSITYREWKAGAKYGEYCQLLQKPDGSFSVITAGTGNGDLYLFEENNSWSYQKIDSISKHSSNPFLEETRLFETFDGLSSTINPNGMIDITYGISEMYGRNRTSHTTVYFSPKHLVLNHLRIYPDGSITNHSILPRDSVYRAYTTIKSKGLDTLFMTYSEPANRRIRFAWSADSGSTWQHSTFITMEAPTEKIYFEILNDTIVGVFFHTEMEILMKATLPLTSLSNPVWAFSKITQNQNQGVYIASEIQVLGSDTLVHLAYSDVLEKKLFYAKKQAGIWSIECIDSNKIMIDVQIQLDKNQAVHVAYTDQTQSFTRLKKKSGSFWSSDIITSGAFSYLQFKIASDTLHACYFDDASSTLYYLRKIGNGIWLPELVCTNAGEYPSLEVGFGGLPHISYYLRDKGCLIYTYKNPSTPTIWSVDTVTIKNGHDLGQWSDLMLIKNQPSVVYRNSTFNTLEYAEKSNNLWSHVTVQDDGIGLVGFPSKLKADSSAIPYILFNETNTVSQFFMIRRVSKTSPWTGLQINNNDGQLSNIFDMNIVGKSIYIAGKKNAYRNEGLALLSLNEVPYVSREKAALSKIQAFVYPNPAQNHTNLVLQLNQTESVNISIWNLNGQCIKTFEKEKTVVSGKSSFVLDLNDLTPQTYWILLETKEDRKIIPIVKF